MLKSATDVQAAVVGFRIAEARNWCFAKVHLDTVFENHQNVAHEFFNLGIFRQLSSV